jgi:hypothetical protein
MAQGHQGCQDRHGAVGKRQLSQHLHHVQDGRHSGGQRDENQDGRTADEQQRRREHRPAYDHGDHHPRGVRVDAEERLPSMLDRTAGFLVRTGFFVVSAFPTCLLMRTGSRFSGYLLVGCGTFGGFALALDGHADDEQDSGYRYEPNDQQQAPP